MASIATRPDSFQHSKMSMSSVDTLMSRPPEQHVREFKYRFAQTVVFGLPVLALQFFGPSLGGAPEESRRWIAVLQALLTGWVTYVAAAGMLAEGILLLGKRFSLDPVVAAIAVGLYLVSLGSALGVLVRGQPLFDPMLFHVVVILLAVWCGWRWWRLSHLA